MTNLTASLSSSYRLSAEQEAAVLSDASAIVVVASAGSGKTEVVARRVERLLTQSPTEAFRVLALSYTVKAAEELGARFATRLGDLRRRVDTNTVHGFAHSLLRQHGTRIGLPVEPEVLTRDEDRAELLARWLRAEGLPLPPNPVTVFQKVDVARARQESAPLVDEWEAALQSAGALDYGSMLLQATELLQLPSARRQLTRLYTHIIVDEAQNLTAAQYTLLSALIGPLAANPREFSAMLVGDEKQSIVSFAGADPSLIRRFEHDYQAKRFELRQNFRSAARIVQLGSAVAQTLGQNGAPQVSPTEYAADGKVSIVAASNEEEEGRQVATWALQLVERGLPREALAEGEDGLVRPEEIAVLARSAAALRATRTALEAAGHRPALSSLPDDWLSTLVGKVAFEMVAFHSASDHQSTHWQLARLLSADERDVRTADALSHVLANHTEQGVRALSPLCFIDSAHEFIDALHDLEVSAPEAPALANWDADFGQLKDAWRQFVEQTDRAQQTWGNFRLHVSRVQRGDQSAVGIRLSTIHRAQGREYRAVALVGLNDGQLPDFRANSSEDQRSELRAFYVAITRPSRVLLLSRAQSRQTRYGVRATTPSPYLHFANDPAEPSR